MEFSRQEYWSGLPFPSPGDLPDPGIEPGSPALQADALQSEPPGKSNFCCFEDEKHGCWHYLLEDDDLPGSSDGKVSIYNARDLGSNPVLGRSPGEGNGNPLQYYCLENPLDRGAW